MNFRLQFTENLLDDMNPALKRIHQAALSLFAERGATQVTISDLAEAAAVARGTIYNNLNSTENLFEAVASQLESEMLIRTSKSLESVEDPAQRLANGIRFFVRRAHEEPDWGRFLIRFSMTNAVLKNIWTGPPMQDLLSGLDQNRYRFRQEQIPSIAGLIGGGVLASMVMVVEGHKTWREAGSDTAEFILRSIGISAEDAIKLATTELPLLPTLDEPKKSRKSESAVAIAKPASSKKPPEKIKGIASKKK
jgi:AcrR family transcriptional regulator